MSLETSMPDKGLSRPETLDFRAAAGTLAFMTTARTARHHHHHDIPTGSVVTEVRG
jgi:hypothetical protein